MRYTNENGYGLVHQESAKDLVFSECVGDSVHIEYYIYTTEKLSSGVSRIVNLTPQFNLTMPVQQGKVTIPLKKWLAGFIFPSYAPEMLELGVNTWEKISTHFTVRDDVTGHTAGPNICPGRGVAGSNPLFVRDGWQTYGPRRRVIYPGDRLFLSRYHEGSISVSLVSYIRQDGCLVADADTTIQVPTYTTIFAFTIASLKALLGTSADVVRFEVGPWVYDVMPADPSVHEFVFRNTLGWLDCIHSFGATKDVTEYETDIFVRDGVEEEINVDTRRWREVNTGRCRSEDHRKLWLEFFESPERYILDDDGVIRRIVVKDIECDQTLGAASYASFKYKTSIDYTGRRVTPMVLPEQT